MCILSHFLPVHVGVAFTTSNAQKAVEMVKWLWNYSGLGYSLRVPNCADEVQRKYSHLPRNKEALIKYWMERDPRASWRGLIVALDAMGEKQAADGIRHLAEPLSGVYKCT